MWVNLKNGREAVTHITVLERHTRYTYVKARLETGRTHQIRVHMAHIGHPVLGDPVYGTPARGLNGQALHAAKLGFVHPDGRYMEFEAELPEYFREYI
jgi:23S rRNA pseudouridine1911/1915/1917 synthase